MFKKTKVTRSRHSHEISDSSAFCPLHPKGPTPVCQMRCFLVPWYGVKVGKGGEEDAKELRDFLKSSGPRFGHSPIP